MQRAVGMPTGIDHVERALRRHVHQIAVAIGERSIAHPDNLRKTEAYIGGFYAEVGLPVTLEPYRYKSLSVSNVITEVAFSENPARRYVLGAHCDTVPGTVGADDNASGLAIQLETARILHALAGDFHADLAVRIVSFALEERPAFWSPGRGSWVHAMRARESGVRIDGMICLEMVGYRSREPGSQHYPFPLMHLNYRKAGDFIAIIGDSRSTRLANSIAAAFEQNPDLPTQSLIVPLNGWLTPFVRRSDHVSFWDLGFQAVMLTDTAEFRNPHYHKPTDTPDTLDYAFMAELVESLLIFFLRSTEELTKRESLRSPTA